MKRLFLSALYSLFAICGILQYFLLAGVIWNVVFPFVQIILVITAVKYIKDRKFVKGCAVLICVVTIVNFGMGLYSSTNTKGFEVKREISVMTYNLFFKNKSMASSVSVIKDANPDILMVQELTPAWNSKLVTEFGRSYKYRLVHPLTGTHGIGIYSKFPLSNQKFLSNSSNRPFAQIVDVKIDDQKAQLINTHLASPAVAVENKERFIPLYIENYGIRKSQIIQLNEFAQKNHDDCDWQLLIGDMNTLQSEPIFKRLKLNWVNSISHSIRWLEFNFPNSNKIAPIMTLDYILGRGRMEFIDSGVIDGGGSDHLAIVANVRI